MRTFLRPHLVDRAAWDDAASARAAPCWSWRRAWPAASSTGTPAGSARYLGIPAAQARWMTLDPGEPDVVLSRLDAFLTPRARASSRSTATRRPASATATAWPRSSRRLPLFRQFAADHAVSYVPSAPSLVRALLAEWARRGGRRAPVVAIVDWAEVKTRADQEILRAALRGRGRALRAGRPARDGRSSTGGCAPAPTPWTSSTAAPCSPSWWSARTRSGRSWPPIASGLRGLRELVPLRALGGQGLLRHPDRRGLRGPPDAKTSGALVAARGALDAQRGGAAHAQGRARGGPRALRPGPRGRPGPEAGPRLRRALGARGRGDDAASLGGGRATRPSAPPWVVQERVPIPQEEFPVCEGGRPAPSSRWA